MAHQHVAPVTQQAAQRRIPTVYVIVDLCQANTVFPVKIDFKMSAEILREHAFSLFQTFCRDNGVPFKPPSLRAVDYTLAPSFEDGQLDSAFGPLVLAQHGGATIRDQMLHLPSPCYASMVIGEQWLERDAVFQEEDGIRQAVIEKRIDVLETMEYFFDISKERALDLQLQRERQETQVQKMEDLLCYMYVAWSRHETQVHREDDLLKKGEALWQNQCSKYEKEMDQILQKKRMFFQSSTTNVLTLTSAMNADHGSDDGKRQEILALLEGFSN